MRCAPAAAVPPLQGATDQQPGAQPGIHGASGLGACSLGQLCSFRLCMLGLWRWHRWQGTMGR